MLWFVFFDAAPRLAIRGTADGSTTPRGGPSAGSRSLPRPQGATNAPGRGRVRNSGTECSIRGHKRPKNTPVLNGATWGISVFGVEKEKVKTYHIRRCLEAYSSTLGLGGSMAGVRAKYRAPNAL